MKVYSENNNIVEKLKKIFPETEVQLQKIKFGGQISVFFVPIDSESILEQIWNSVSSSIAAYYQAHLNDDFEKWNIYILFICNSSVKLSLKYKIENDKFSSRKIVIENKNEKLDKVKYLSLINSYIINKDLTIMQENMKTEKEVYESSSIVWSIVSRLEETTKKSNVEIENILTNIENHLRNENKES